MTDFEDPAEDCTMRDCDCPCHDSTDDLARTPLGVEFTKGQRIVICDGDTGTVIAGPLPDWNGAYEVAVDGDGINYVAGSAMTLIDQQPSVVAS